jgi:hypothetical protein
MEDLDFGIAVVQQSQFSFLIPQSSILIEAPPGADLGPLAQWLELPAHNRLVPGSSPGGPTNSVLRARCLVPGAWCLAGDRRAANPHSRERLTVAHIVERIAIEGDEVGPAAHRNGADIAKSGAARGVHGSRAQHLRGRQS